MPKMVKLVVASSSVHFQSQLDNELTEIESDGYDVVDINYSSFSNGEDNYYTALIVYDDGGYEGP